MHIITDILARFLLALWFLFGAFHQWVKFRSETGAPIVLRLFSILFLLLCAALLVVRRRSIGKAAGVGPRLTAFLGCFIFSVIAYLPASPPSAMQTIVAGVFLAVGYTLALLSLLNLGRSFSVMAEARALKTHGMYRYVRHPLYASEQVFLLGVTVQFFSVYALGLYLLQLWLQLRRMKNEEQVLSKAFPEYRDYQLRTSRLIPGIY